MIIIESADNTAAISTHSAANRRPERPVNTSFDARRVNPTRRFFLRSQRLSGNAFVF